MAGAGFASRDMFVYARQEVGRLACSKLEPSSQGESHFMPGFPDEHQRKVIEHRGRPLVVIAGPGCGKTRTLVERARAILASEPESNIAFVTFTRTSRRDTKRKLENVLAADETTRDQDFPKVSTLHGFAKSILHKAPQVMGLDRGFCVLVPEKEQELVISEVVEDLSREISRTALRRAIARQKNTGVLQVPDGVDPAGLLRATEHYEELCRFYGAIDIEGLVNAAARIVQEERINLPPLYLHVDEYQDLNQSDQKLVWALLAKGPKDVVVVGDDDQSIYGLRDARPEGIRELFGNSEWDKVVFRESHRLPGHIVRASQALIVHHRSPRLDKGIEIPDDDGRRVPAFICTTDDIEIEFVAALIRKEIGQSKGERNLSYGHFMVLCPTRAIANTFAKQLKEKWNIPVRGIAPRSIPDDLWRILLALRMAAGDDNLALRQWLEVLKIPPDEVRTIRSVAVAEKRTLFEVMRESRNEALGQFMKDLGELREARDDLGELLRKAKFLAGVTTLPLEAEAESLSGLISRLYEEYGLLEPEEGDTESDEVLVTTLHSSKGLEAEVVIIVQLSSRYMPNPSRDSDEELRVLYVGMTRAKKELYLSSSYVFDPQKRRKRPSISAYLNLIKPHLSIQKISRRKK